MGGSFDLIAQEMLKQKRIMEKLMEENRILRQHIAQLRTGHGIFVEVGGQRIALNLLLEGVAPTTPAPTTHQVTGTEQHDAVAPTIVASPKNESADLSQPTDPRIPVVPKAAPVAPRVVPAASGKQENAKKAPSTFLEEMMVDEFSAAMTRPTAVWTGPARQPEITDEEKKAELRKELMGSFLLE